MFSITGAKGVQMTFANGITISVQWGPGNYCSNSNSFDFQAPINAAKEHGHWSSDTAEIAVWSDRSEVWLTRYFLPDAGDDVKGHLTTDEVGALIGRIQALSSDEVGSIKVKSLMDSYSD